MNEKPDEFFSACKGFYLKLKTGNPIFISRFVRSGFMEIGSEFHISSNNKLTEKEFIFKDNNYLLNYGRTALKFLMESLKDMKPTKGILLPNYLCESIILPLTDIGIPFEFYKVDKHFKVVLNDLEGLLKPDWAVLVLDYFNIRQDKEILNYLQIIKKTNIIVEDITHSLFDQKDPIGHFQIASLRKWLGIPSGSLIRDFYKGNLQNYVLPETCEENRSVIQKRLYAATLKSFYIENGLNNDTKLKFLDLFAESEMILDTSDIKVQYIDEISKEIIHHYDFKTMMGIRKRNYKFLFDDLSKIQEIEVMNGVPNRNKVPLGFPINVQDRDALRSSLIKEQIYPPVHWPLPKELLLEPTDDILNISKSILTLPCDQRYSETDMKRVVNVIKNHYCR